MMWLGSGSSFTLPKYSPSGRPQADSASAARMTGRIRSYIARSHPLFEGPDAAASLRCALARAREGADVEDHEARGGGVVGGQGPLAQAGDSARQMSQEA